MDASSNRIRRTVLGAVLVGWIAPALGAGGGGHEGDGPDIGAQLAAAQKLIDAKDWKGAIAELQRAQRYNDRNADVHNLLRHSLRHTGRLKDALGHYERALQLDPGHRGAHEYAGEVWLQARDPAKARAHLTALRKLRGTDCEQYRDLAQAISTYEQGSTTTSAR